ncbi:unnamed protein product [Protopolystoma xenopodis]|uniref:Cation-transporting P-type ATPase C-terminal domain-containing protein n=1 Tax=Protopolystoma xenopodis TaxID=117903 RepID=A0A448XHP0_9PLAT|nr:unnamed protein product [Protopolystoma xenopodis]
MRRECIGDASEKAFLKFTEDRIGNVLAFRTAHPKLAEIPFNSANKFQVSIHHCQENDKLKQGPLLVMKGAPERVFERCSTIYMKGKSLPIVRHVREQFDEVFLKLGGIGERVLGFADCYLPRQPYSNKNFKFDTNKVNFPIKELRFLGFVSLVDPPRASVPYSIAKCREAGIQVVMVTGDHPVTAKAIARAVGIISPNSYTREELAQQRGLSIEQIDPRETTACVVHGGQLREMSTGQLDEILNLYSEIVFARTSPTQKLNIVESFQRRQKFVAVTGDGVNDSPALRRANIGVAMGISGSDVSKQVADMILLDDNFSTIVTGIEEGRVIFDNLKKSIAYTMTSKIPELLPFILFMLFDLPLMMGTVTILCIDLGTDMLPAISMAYEVAEKDIMKRKPRDPKKDRLVNARLLAMAFLQIGVMQALAALFTAFLVFSVNGFLPDRLYGLRSDWTDKTNKALIDSYGQEWTMSQRMELQYTVYTCFFVTVVIVQWTDLLICKTRRLSIFQHGCANNKMTFALFFETGLALLLQMVPGLNVALQLRPMRYSWWCAGLPWALLILIYDELRKAWIRRYPDGFIFEETYY